MNLYAIVEREGCRVIVFHQHDRWYARAPGNGASNYGPRASVGSRDMTISDALSAWRFAGKPVASAEHIPPDWKQVALVELH